jgi:VIT1/CCC1 family predicted Fe2+/Mn2+ transporter
MLSIVWPVQRLGKGGAMSNQDDLERIRKIRDRQLGLRDHSVETKRVQHEISKKRRRSVEKFSFGGIFKDIPKMIIGTLIGMVLGILVFLILPYLTDAAWVDIAGVIITIFGAVFGFFYGRAMDAKDALSDF